MIKLLKKCLFGLFIFLGVMPLSAMLQPGYPTNSSNGQRKQSMIMPKSGIEVKSTRHHVDLEQEEEFLKERCDDLRAELNVTEEKKAALHTINNAGKINFYNYYRIGRLLTVAMGSVYMVYKNTPEAVKEALGSKYLLGCFVASGALAVVDFFHPITMTVLYAGIGIGRYSHYFDAQVLTKFVQKAAPEVVQKAAEVTTQAVAKVA